MTKDVEPYTIVGGNPAKIIKKDFQMILLKKYLNSITRNYPMTLFLIILKVFI